MTPPRSMIRPSTLAPTTTPVRQRSRPLATPAGSERGTGNPADWFLSRAQRGNDASDLDRQADQPGQAWTVGNTVRPLVHGREYFRELLRAISGLSAGDLLMFTDWRGDPDERLAGSGTEVARVLRAAVDRGVLVKALVWRSHPRFLQFSQRENRRLSELIDDAGGESLLDTRVRFGGCHHQKLVVLRHRGRPDRDVAFVGGIDLCHSRNDDARHRGDPQAVPMAKEYGDRPPWHDVQAAVRGPAVAAFETVFRERWEDRTPVTRNPFHRAHDAADGLESLGDALPPQWPAPEPCGEHAVQVLRTYPYRRPGYPFAPEGERSIARGYRKAIAKARSLIYLEDQYLWSPEVADVFAQALVANPELRLIAVVPAFSDQASAFTRIPQLLGRSRALDVIRRAGGDRVAVYSLENKTGTPVYVHAKVCIVDDEWATIGSDNLNLRSWTYDSELTCAVVDPTGGYARELRQRLNREHLGYPGKGDPIPAADVFDRYARSAAALDRWHAGGRVGKRPAGRLRRYHPPRLSPFTRLWASALYRFICDPDGRPRALRRRREF